MIMFFSRETKESTMDVYLLYGRKSLKKNFFFSSKTFGSYNRSHSLNQLCMCVCVKNNVAKTSKLHYYEKRMKGNVFQ